MWTVTRGTLPSVPQLEDNLSNVKALYKVQFSRDIDRQDSDDEQCMHEVSLVWPQEQHLTHG